MQYFGAVFNLANTVRNFFSFFGSFFYLTFVSKQAVSWYSCDAHAFEQSGLAMGLLIIVAVVTLCALSRDCHIGYVLFISLSSFYHEHAQLQ